MRLSEQEKNTLKRDLVDCLRTEKEVRRIVVFGSFLHPDDPHDLDVAVFQDTTEPYLPLAMKYRKKTRSIARRIPLDILPVKFRAQTILSWLRSPRERSSMNDDARQAVEKSLRAALIERAIP